MHQKDRAKKALVAAGLYDIKDAALKRLFSKLETEPLHCWNEMATEARAYCGEHLEALWRAVWASADPLLRVNLIRQARLSEPKDRALLELAIDECDAEKDRTELRAIIELGDEELNRRIVKKPKVDKELCDFVTVKMGKPQRPAPKKKKKKKKRSE